MRGFWVSLCVPVLVCTAIHAAGAAGFNCSKASTNTEKLICSDQELSALDDRLGEAWRQAMKKSADKDSLKKQQQDWIKTGRDACPDAECLKKAYEERIAALSGQEAPSLPQGMLEEADKQFTFRKKPINPLAFKELLPWLSDRLSGPVAVDLEGTASGTNRYLADVTVDAKGFVCAVQTEGAEKLNFSYKRIGTLANGVHVVETWSSGGGTLVATDLVLVRFSTDTEYPGGSGPATPRDRLIMTRVGAYSLGDRYNGTIEVRPGEIAVGAGGVHAKPQVIRFK